MITVRQPDEITTWFVVFWPGTMPGLNRWTRWVPGHFKHVSAFGYSPACLTWVWYDVGLAGTAVKVLPDTKESERILGLWVDGCTVLHMSAGKRVGPAARLGMFCVPAIRHLLAVPGGAVRPDGFWRDCLRHGAKVVIDGKQPEAAKARPSVGSAARSDGRGEHQANSIEPQFADR